VYELGRVATTPVSQASSTRRGATPSACSRSARRRRRPRRHGLASSAGAGLGVEWLRDHPRQLQAVTVEDAPRRRGRYLAPNRLTTVMVGDVAQVEAPLRTLVDLEVA
jgi:hypothetical protein